MIRVLVVDDHEVVRAGLACLFEDTEVTIVGEAADRTQAVKQARKHQPDVVLLDIRMPDGDGLSALRDIRKQAPDAQVIILSTYDNPTYVARSCALGAADYLLKGLSRDQLLNAIRGALDGQPPSEGGLMLGIANAMSKTARKVDQTDSLFTKREAQVLKHLALGLSNREIGDSLDISVETVKEHVQNILRKLEVTDRTQAAVWAVRQGWV